MQGTGIGPALRKARLTRGKSIEEASRETRIRAEYLQALERETFESMLGAVYVRGFLRSYSTYLGLDADKVLTVYNRHFGGPRPTLPEPVAAPPRRERIVHPHLPEAMRHHPSWTFLIGVALLALAVFSAAGLLRSRIGPGSPLPAAQTTLPDLSGVTVAVKASQPVHITVKADGVMVFRHLLLHKGEGRSFDATASIVLTLDHGGVTQIMVNGHSLGKPGSRLLPYSATFTPQNFRSPKPKGSSASAAGAGGSASSPSGT